MISPMKASTVIALCSAANFINSADRVIMPTAIIQMADEFKWDLHGQGWILSSFAIGYMASGVLGASASKRYGGKLVLATAVFLWSFSTFITPAFAHSKNALILLRVVLGIGEGLAVEWFLPFCYIAFMAEGYIVESQEPLYCYNTCSTQGLPTVFHIFSHTITMEERSKAFGYLIALGSTGQSLSSIICPYLPWRWSFYCFGSLGFIWCIFWMSMYKDVCGAVHETDEEYAEPPKVNNQNVQWRQFIMHWPLWALYIAHFSMNWSSYIVMHWLPTYMKRTLQAEHNQIMYSALPYIMNSVVGVGAGHLADKLVTKYRWPILSVRRLMTGVGLVGPGIFMLCFSNVSNLALALLCVTLSMGLSACNSAGHLSNHAEVAPSFAGTTFAISNTLATIPGILCGPLTAELVTQSGGRWFPVFVIASLMNFVGGIVYISQSSASQVL